ncbi:hypothetical protein TKK_0006281 [Trichogramma kaykai]
MVLQRENNSAIYRYDQQKSLKRKNIISDSRCRCGYEKKNLNRILWDCRLYEAQKGMMLEKLKKIQLFPSLNLKRLIARPTIEACKIFCEYFVGLGMRV